MFGFYAMMGRLRHIRRWSLMRSNVSENVCEHSFDTAVIAHALAEIGNRFFEKDLDVGKITMAALYHDASEVMTGDMPTPVKYRNEALRESYGKIEKESRETLLSMLPDDLVEAYRPLVSMEEESPEEYRYVKAADKISAYIKCMEEIASGNREFSSAEEQTKKAVYDMHFQEADYFMQHFLDGYRKNLDELSNRG